MTPHERAYILRIAAILETGESQRGARNLAIELGRLNAAWDDRAIAAAVAHVRSALAHIPYTTMRFDVTA